MKHNWEQRTLEDLLKLQGGNAFKSTDASIDGVNWLKISNVGVDGINWDSKSYLPYEFWDTNKNARLFKDDYVMALTRPILNGKLKIAKLDTKALLNQRVAKLIFYSDSKFGFQMLKKYNIVKKLENELAGTDPPNLGSKNLGNIKIYMPVKREEQRHIGEILNEIDSIIVLHQRKINILKQIKKAHFNVLFPNKNYNTPILRFNSFQEVWEESSLEEVGDFVRTSVDPQGAPDSEFIEYSMPAYDNSRLPDHVLGKSMRSMRLKISGQVLLINKLNVRQKRIWLIEDAPYNAVASSEFMPFISQTINLVFLEQYMLSDKATRDLESISSGTSNSQKRVTPTNILKYHIKYPKGHNEQEKIGLYFKQIDNIIFLHHSKIHILKRLKKIYLKKIFI